MSKLNIELTPEEAEEFRNMNLEEQKAFMETANKRREQLMLKTTVLSTLLVEAFDELEYFKMTRYKLKQSANNTRRMLLKYMKEVYDINTEESESTEYIARVSKQIDKLL